MLAGSTRLAALLRAHGSRSRLLGPSSTLASSRCSCAARHLSTAPSTTSKCVALEEDTISSWGSNLRGLGHNNYLGKILNARVYEAARETPLQHAPTLSSQLQNSVYFKREDLQPVFSFKIRGAYNKIAQLSRDQLRAGIVACSAGNHAQGVAMSANMLGVDAVIVMPRGTPAIKVDAVRKLKGARTLTPSLRAFPACSAVRHLASRAGRDSASCARVRRKCEAAWRQL